jgi:serine/threonine-protein kinase PknG
VAESPETRLALARSRIVTGDLAGAGTVLADLAVADPDDWRTAWYNGLRDLAAGSPGSARGAFDAVCDALPGELAAKLALAFATEAAGDPAAAGRYYQLVWTVDHAYVSAAFGLARTRLRGGDRPGAIAALAAVPDSSSQHLAAQIAAVRIQVSAGAGPGGAGANTVSPDDLKQAGQRLGLLDLDDAQRQQLTAEVLRAALDHVEANGPLDAGELLGCEFNERSLRFGLESSYRAQAHLAPERGHRIELVDQANDVRPRTWS